MFFWGRENVLLKATLTVLAESVLESFIHFAHFNLTKDLQMSTTLLWAFGQFLSQIPAKSISISLLGQHFSLFRPVGLNLTAPLSNHFKRGFFDCTVSGVIHADLHKSIFLGLFFFFNHVMLLQPFESATCHLCAVCVPSLDLLNVGSWWSLTVHEPPVEQRVIDEGLQHGHDAVPVLPQHLHHRVAGDPVVPVQTGHLSPNQTQPLLVETNLPQHQRVQCLCITERSKVKSGVLSCADAYTEVFESSY